MNNAILSLLQQLDEVLEYYFLVCNSKTRENKPGSPKYINKRILDKLSNDGYIVNISYSKDSKKANYEITYDGIIFHQSGGYKTDFVKVRQSAQNKILVSWLVVIGSLITAIAALLAYINSIHTNIHPTTQNMSILVIFSTNRSTYYRRICSIIFLRYVMQPCALAVYDILWWISCILLTKLMQHKEDEVVYYTQLAAA